MIMRDPNDIMTLPRMGSYHQCGLSFMRTLLRRLKQYNYHVTRTIWDIDDSITGVAVYEVGNDTYTYSLVAFAHDLPDDMRSDRVIAEQWDATFTLVVGKPTIDDIERLRHNVPKQEGGRVSVKEIALSRANKSVRLWDIVVNALSNGEQPNIDDVIDIGYIMRTTAVYGSSKFGTNDFINLLDQPLLHSCFRAELLTVWLIRCFSLDLVEYAAHVKNPKKAVPLRRDIRRTLGVGNSTGLGMAPYIMNHPMLVHEWISRREHILSDISHNVALDDIQQSIHDILQKNYNLYENHHSHSPIQQQKNADILHDIPLLLQQLDKTKTIDELITYAHNNLSLEGQELLHSTIIDTRIMEYDSLCDFPYILEREATLIDGTKPLSFIREIIKKNYMYCFNFDMQLPENKEKFWYVSENKLEPRLGERYQEDGADQESPFNIIEDIQLLWSKLEQADLTQHIADFVRDNAEQRHIIRRILIVNQAPYGEIRDNLVGHDMLALNLLRLKLSFFGATKFDPRSDRWLRITMYQYAPFPDELAQIDIKHLDSWVYG